MSENTNDAIIAGVSLLASMLPQRVFLDSLRRQFEGLLAQAAQMTGSRGFFIPGGRETLRTAIVVALHETHQSGVMAQNLHVSEAKQATQEQRLVTMFRESSDAPWYTATDAVVDAACSIVDITGCGQVRFESVLNLSADIAAMRAAVDEARDVLPRWTHGSSLRCASYRPLRLCRGKFLRRVRPDGVVQWPHDCIIIPDGMGPLYCLDFGLRGNDASSGVGATTEGELFSKGDGNHGLNVKAGGTIIDLVWVGGNVAVYVFSTAASTLAHCDPRERDLISGTVALPRSVMTLQWADVTAKGPALSSTADSIRRVVGARSLVLTGDRAGYVAAWLVERGKRGMLPLVRLAQLQLLRVDGGADTSPVKAIEFVSEMLVAVVCTMESHISVINGFPALDLTTGYAPLTVSYVFVAGNGCLKAMGFALLFHAVFVGCGDGTVELWTLAQRMVPASAAALASSPLRLTPRDKSCRHDASVGCVAVSSSLPIAFSADAAGCVMIWALESFTLLQTIAMPSKGDIPRFMMLTRDSRTLVVASRASLHAIRASADGVLLAIHHAARASHHPKERSAAGTEDATTLSAGEDMTALVAMLLGAVTCASGDVAVVYTGGVQWLRSRPLCFLPYPPEKTLNGGVRHEYLQCFVADNVHCARALFLGTTAGEVLIVNALTGGLHQRFPRHFQMRCGVASIVFLEAPRMIAVFGETRGLLHGDLVMYNLRVLRDPADPPAPTGILRQVGDTAFYLGAPPRVSPVAPRLVAVCNREAVRRPAKEENNSTGPRESVIVISFFDSLSAPLTGNLSHLTEYTHTIKASCDRLRGRQRSSDASTDQADDGKQLDPLVSAAFGFETVTADPEVVGIHLIPLTEEDDLQPVEARQRPNNYVICIVDSCGHSVVSVPINQSAVAAKDARNDHQHASSQHNLAKSRSRARLVGSVVHAPVGAGGMSHGRIDSCGKLLARYDSMTANVTASALATLSLPVARSAYHASTDHDSSPGTITTSEAAVPLLFTGDDTASITVHRLDGATSHQCSPVRRVGPQDTSVRTIVVRDSGQVMCVLADGTMRETTLLQLMFGDPVAAEEESGESTPHHSMYTSSTRGLRGVPHDAASRQAVAAALDDTSPRRGSSSLYSNAGGTTHLPPCDSNTKNSPRRSVARERAAGHGTLTPTLTLDRRLQIPEVSARDCRWVAAQLNALCGGLQLDLDTGLFEPPVAQPARYTPSGIAIYYQFDSMSTWERCVEMPTDGDDGEEEDVESSEGRSLRRTAGNAPFENNDAGHAPRLSGVLAVSSNPAAPVIDVRHTQNSRGNGAMTRSGAAALSKANALLSPASKAPPSYMRRHEELPPLNALH